MPFQEFFEFTHIKVTAAQDQNSGFFMDCKALLKVAEACKRLDELVPGWLEDCDMNFEPEARMLFGEIQEFVTWFFPSTAVPGVTARTTEDDLPNLVLDRPANRQQRRAAGLKSVKARYVNGEWVES